MEARGVRGSVWFDFSLKSCGSKAYQVYFDDVKDSSQESRVKTSFKNQRDVQSRINGLPT